MKEEGDPRGFRYVDDVVYILQPNEDAAADACTHRRFPGIKRSQSQRSQNQTST